MMLSMTTYAADGTPTHQSFVDPEPDPEPKVIYVAWIKRELLKMFPGPTSWAPHGVEDLSCSD